METNDLKVKLFYNRQALVIYLFENITLELFYEKIRKACKLSSNLPITVKWIDNEDDPCTISSQLELMEAIRLTYEAKESELKVHIFLGIPLSPGAPCPGEDKTVYRRGARRWQKKMYHVNGHTFQPKRFNQRIECALCLDSIWGLGRAGLKCVDCEMCVHKKCHKFVNAKCPMKFLNYDQTIDSKKPQPTNKNDFIDNKIFEKSNYTESSNLNFDNLSQFNQENSVKITSNKIDNSKETEFSMSLDDYEILTVIGRGSYAKVMQAEHKKSGQIYAIKIIKKETCTDEEDIDWIQTEKSVFETASNHPFLVGLHSCFQSSSRLFFVIEFIPGGDLMFHMQKTQRLHEDHARFYSAEIILALHFLHSRGIIYRDLKLDNVLLDADGHIKLTDFGMCKENIGPQDVTSTFCGTPNYIAPEILRGEDYGFSVDFWALGVLMFEMMAGCSPFHIPPNEEVQKTEDHLFQAILEKQIRIPRFLSVRAANILKGFLNKDPKERLGCKLNIEEGLIDIKMHSYFKNSIDWDQLEQKQVVPPYNPNIYDDRDLQRFDTSFTNEEPILTPDDPSIIEKIDQSEFEGFEYINPLIMSREDSV